ncbi:hypothetical protein DB347_20625 [Opitutaceae bacterium EW11]|nr:hypothetical protein DB347_20625 [Opitutaceae bacterium EW11]
MKAFIYQISGALILLAALGYALEHISTADAWVSEWTLFVAAGVAVSLVGAILQRRSKKAYNGIQ